MTKLPESIQDHFDDPYHRGVGDCSTHAADVVCEVSGCAIRLELALGDGPQVLEAWFDGQGCPVCEGLTSLLAEWLEGREVHDFAGSDARQLLNQLGIQLDSLAYPCATLPYRALQTALVSPLEELEDDLADGSQFGGPSLREEC